MKLLIASDIHGASTYCRKLMDALDAHQPDRLVLLGDMLYHGPRNDVPADYAPKQVIAMLNSIAGSIIAVRGNCEAEVDQMVLDFPCMGEYNIILDPSADSPAGAPAGAGAEGKGLELFCTHGHIHTPSNLPNIPAGSVFVYGHTHVKVNEPSREFPQIRLFNPGSVGIPKDGSHSYGIYQNGEFSHIVID